MTEHITTLGMNIMIKNKKDFQWGNFKRTCSIDNPVDGGLAYVTDTRMLEKLVGWLGELTVFIPNNKKIPESLTDYFGDNFTLVNSPTPFLDFVIAHNAINACREPKENNISEDAFVHPSAEIGPEGMRYVKKDDKIISMKHMGNVRICSGVSIGALTTVARAIFDSTIIGCNVKIDCGCHIGHNCIVGDNTLIIEGVNIGGSVKIGKNCYIGLGSLIRNGVTVPPKTLIGMGSVVTKSISVPGVYYGNPVKYIEPWNGEWP